MTTAQIGFHVDPKYGLGLEVCIVNGTGFVENVHPQGSVFEWNTYIPQKLQICPGDRIDGWKVKGKRVSRLTTAEQLYPLHHRAIILKVTRPSHCVVSVCSPFGIIIKRDNLKKALFFISYISYWGSIQKWNEQNPENLVSVGDIIMGVNGVRCTESEIRVLGKSGHTVVELMVLHFEECTASR